MKEVLVVDDSQPVRHELTAVLNAAGFGTLEAADGEAGLAMARAHAISLIILDVNMPRMNGLQMLELLRLDWATANVPVVILTTEAEAPMVERARRAGAKGWLIKPVSPAHLVSTVLAVMERAPGQS